MAEDVKISVMPTYNGSVKGAFIPVVVNGVNRKVDLGAVTGAVEADGGSFDQTLISFLNLEGGNFSTVYLSDQKIDCGKF